MNASGNGINSPLVINAQKPANLESIYLSFSQNWLNVGESVNATVTAYYSDGSSKNISSQSTLTGDSYLSINGSEISSVKKIGCLGSHTVCAAYEGLTSYAQLNVETDFDSISLWCEVSCGNTGSWESGDETQWISVIVPDGGENVNMSLSGTISTMSEETIDIDTCDFVEVWYENKMLRKGGFYSTDWLIPGWTYLYIYYLGEKVFEYKFEVRARI